MNRRVSQLRKRLSWLREKLSQLRSRISLKLALFAAAVVLAGLIWLGYWVQGTGFSAYRDAAGEHGYKTLWDWLDLLIVPIVLAAGAWWLSSQERSEERSIATARTQDKAIQQYLDTMANLLLEHKLREVIKQDPDAEAAGVARARTLTVLRQLDPARKGEIVRFLADAKLIDMLSLEGANLRGARLERANLKEADLRAAHLEKANLEGAHLEGAYLEGTYLGGANLAVANLRGASLEGAYLERAYLGGARYDNTTVWPEDFDYMATNCQDVTTKKLRAIMEPKIMSELIPAASRDLLTTGKPLPGERNPAAVYLAGLSSERARRAMLGRLRYMAGLLGADDPLAVPWHMLRYQHAAAIRARLIESGQAPATINLSLSALRGVAREAFSLGLLSADDYARIRQVKNVRGERLPSGRSLSHGELAALVEACASDPTNAGPRDCAIIGVMYTGGLRREEVPALDLADYDPASGELRVSGKGDKERRVYINNGTGEALADWLKARGTEAGPLFLPVTRGGHIQRRRLNPQTIYDMLARRAEQAGVRAFSPHDLRRTFVGDLLDAGADVVTVQALAGHASVTTTARYDRRPEETKRKASSLLHLPYRGRRTRGRSEET